MDIKLVLTSFELHAVVLLILFAASVFTLMYLWHALRPEISRSSKLIFSGIALLFCVSAVYSGWHMFGKLTGVPQIKKTVPINGEIIDPNSPDITIYFNAPVHTRTLAVHSFPEIEFTVKMTGLTSITIAPKTTLPPGERFMVYLSNIEGPLTRGYGGEQLIELMTPEVDVSAVSIPEGSHDIPVKEEISVTTTTIINEKEWTVQIEPNTPISIKKTDDKKMNIIFEDPLRQNTSYILTFVHTPIISDRATGNEIKKLDASTKEAIHFMTVRSALIASFSPNSNAANPQDDIKIVFEQPMNKDEVTNHISITPNIGISSSWHDGDTTLLLKHDALARDTLYTITIAKDAKTAKGGILDNEAVFTFHTAGPLKIVNTSPAKNATNISINTTLKISFDQEITKSIESHFAITPNIPGKKVITDKTIEFIPDDPLPKETRFSIMISKGAESLYGLPSTNDETIVFTTSQNQTGLTVPYFRQQTLFTCNIAAARMLLAFRGVNVTETDLINVIGLGGKRGSGNPHKGYVDDYGTYWDAISRGVSKYRTTRIITSGKLSDIIIEVKKGNPVMTWGQNGWSDPHDISWTSSDGTHIKAINGMHSAVVRGYSGPDDNPTQIFINDPWRGQYSLPTAEFIRRWNFVKMAMVVD